MTVSGGIGRAAGGCTLAGRGAVARAAAEETATEIEAGAWGRTGPGVKSGAEGRDEARPDPEMDPATPGPLGDAAGAPETALTEGANVVVGGATGAGARVAAGGVETAGGAAGATALGAAEGDVVAPGVVEAVGVVAGTTTTAGTAAVGMAATGGGGVLAETGGRMVRSAVSGGAFRTTKRVRLTGSTAL